MNENIQKYCFSSILQDGETCTNPTLTILGSEGIDISCQKGLCVEFSFIDGAESHCINVEISCPSCNCDPIIEKKCFCDLSADCPNGCEYCSADGICVSYCPTGKLCDDDTCVDCNAEHPCPCNQNCVQGTCQCPPSLPIVNISGCCVECTQNSHCDPCEVCVGGQCVPKDCQDGHCNPVTGLCNECYTNEHCGANECCVNGNCECCGNFYRDPVTGLCIEIPECFTSADCKDCEDCLLGDCVPRICPAGQVCINDTCVDGCVDPSDCPNGQGCLGGECVDCSSLSCTGNISLCSQAAGCICDNGTCTFVDCQVLENCVDWDITPPVVVPGTPVPGTGLPALAFTVTWEDLGLVPMVGSNGLFRDYRFTLTQAIGVSGIWSVGGVTLGVGSTITFELSDPGPLQWNNVGFEIEFQESPGSRTASIVVYNNNWFNINPANASESFFADLMTAMANWVVNVQSNPTLPSSTGGSYTPGNLKLCPCNPNATIIGSTWTTIEGNLTVTFQPLAGGCLQAIVQGCGTGEGTVTINCAGFITTLPIPPLPYDYSGDNCCDPLTDPNCTGNPGDGTPCGAITVLSGDIVLSQMDFTLPSGAGLFRGVFLPNSIGLSIAEWIRSNRDVCWSTTGTMMDAGTFIPPTLSGLFHDVEYLSGNGCLRMGYNCEIRIGHCQKVQAEACFSGCDPFTVDISNVGGVLTALPSIGNGVQLTYAWRINQSQTIVGTGSTYTLPSPNTTITYVSVTVTLNVNGSICTAVADLAIPIDTIFGCKDITACNFNPAATATDNSCCFLDDVTYTCNTGLRITSTCPGIIYWVLGSPDVPYTQGMTLSTGTAIVVGRRAGVEVCRETLHIPQCYLCNNNTCIPAIPNLGAFTDDPFCGHTCGCTLQAAISHECIAGKTIITVQNVQGGSGNYLLLIKDSLGNQIYPALPAGALAFTGASVVTTSAMCQSEYLISIQDAAGPSNGCPDIHYDSACFACNDTQAPFTITNYFYECANDRFRFTLNPDPCATYYDIVIKFNGNGPSDPVVGTGHFANLTGPFSTSINYVNAALGTYYLNITDSRGCTKVYTTFVDCDDVTPACPIVANSFQVSTTESGGTIHFTFDVEISGSTTYTYAVSVFESDCFGNIIPPQLGNTDLFVLSPGIYDNMALTYNPTTPGGTTCYKVILVGQNPLSPLCQGVDEVTVIPGGGGTPTCAFSSFSVTNYNTSTHNFLVSWNAANTSGNLTLRTTVWNTGVCGVGSSTVTNVTGLSNVGINHITTVPQLDGVAQCVTFLMFDTANPSCTTSPINRVVPACTCSVAFDSVVYNAGLGRIEYEYTGACATLPIEFIVEFNERSVAGCTGSTVTLDSYSHITLTGSGNFPIVAPGLDRYIEVVITDGTNALCTDSACIVVPGCNTCTTQNVLIPASRILSLQDVNAVNYGMPNTVDFECVATGGVSTVNDNAALALAAQLTAAGDCGTPIVTWASPVANLATCLNTVHNTQSLFGAQQHLYTGITINGTDYLTSIAYANWSGSVLTLISAAPNAIEAHMTAALASEGIAFSTITVGTEIVTPNTSRIRCLIQGIGAGNVLSMRTSVSGGAYPGGNNAFSAGCVANNGTPSEGLCLVLTIAGSGFTFDSSSMVEGIFYFDNTGC